MRGLFQIMLGLCILPFGAYAIENCTEVRFAPGTSLMEIQDEAPPEGVICYRMRTGKNQEARIQVLEGSNTIIAVLDVAEGRQEIAFTTQARQYEIWVGQSLRAIEAQPFRMLISVK